MFKDIDKVVKAFEALDKVFQAMMNDIDDGIPDIGGDLALDISLNWRSALENAYALKSMSEKFSHIRIQGER